MGNDFFEEDANKTANTGRDRIDRGEDASTRPISDASLTRMMRQKEQVMTQVAGAAQELEQLRFKQETLEREKTELQDLTRRQEEYEKGKQEVVERLIQSLVMLEKEETQATRMLETVAAVRAKYKDALAELKGIEEDKWLDEAYSLELNKAWTRVEETRAMYKQGVAKVEAARWQKGVPSDSGGVFDDVAEGLGVTKNFAYWVKMGLGTTLPLMVFFAVLFVVYVCLQGLYLPRGGG